MKYKKLSVCMFFLFFGVFACQGETTSFKESDMTGISNQNGVQSNADATTFSRDDSDSNSPSNIVQQGANITIEIEKRAEGETTAPSENLLAANQMTPASDDTNDSSETDIDRQASGAAETENSNLAATDPVATPPVSASDTNQSSGDNSEESALAKDCDATKIKIVNSNSKLTNLSLSSDTVLAVKITGGSQNLKINLNGDQAAAGLCLILRGHDNSIQLTVSSTLKKLVYLASGDSNKGEITLNKAILLESKIEMSGHSPSLRLAGVESRHCENAVLKNDSASVVCEP